MKILIVEPEGKGHHIALHLSSIVQKFISSNLNIYLLTTRSAVSHPSFKLIKTKIKKKIKINYLPELRQGKSLSTLNLLLDQFINWKNLRNKYCKILKTNPPDIVYVPTIDWIIKAIGILGSPFKNTPFIALYMKPKHHARSIKIERSSFLDWLDNILFKKILKIKSLKKLLVIDEFFLNYSRRQYGNLFYKIKYVPDFSKIKLITSKQEARKNLGISNKSKVILVYGSLQFRKGIKELLVAFQDNQILKDIVILLAGQPDDDVKKLVKSLKIKKLISQKRLFTFLNFHNSHDEQQVFAASDAIWLGYDKKFFGSSGVFYQAIFSDLLFIGQDQGIIGHKIKKYNLGLTIPINNTKKVIKNINNIFNQSPINLNKMKKSRKLLKNLHNSDKHCDLVYNLIKTSLK